MPKSSKLQFTTIIVSIVIFLLSVSSKVFFFLRTMHKNWYIINTMSGYENKVKYNLDTDIRNSSQKDNIGNIILPFEKKETHSIKNRPGVINFLTDKKGGKPIPMKKVAELRISFSIGEKVQVFYVTIDTINEEKLRMSITVLIFGKKTPLDINFYQGYKKK